MEQHFIYKLSSPSKKIYIGRTIDFDSRMADHKHSALTKKSSNSLYKAIRKYGWESFDKEIIATTLGEENAKLLEESLIKQFNSVKNGYNDTYIGSGGNIYKDQPEKLENFKKKMSSVTAGEKNGMYGKQQTEEAKQKQREKALGRFTLQWYIDRHGEEEGTNLYKQRSDNLKKRNLPRNKKGVFIPNNKVS